MTQHRMSQTTVENDEIFTSVVRIEIPEIGEEPRVSITVLRRGGPDLRLLQSWRLDEVLPYRAIAQDGVA